MLWLKKPTTAGAIRLNRLCWFGHVQRMEENRIPKKVLYMNLEATRLRGRPRNRWQDEGREDGWLIVGKGWKERLYNRQKWKKLLRTARNHRILHKPMEWMNECVSYSNKWISPLPSPETVSWWPQFTKCSRSAKICFTVVLFTKSRTQFQRHTFTDNTLQQVTEPSEWLSVKVGHFSVLSREMLLWRKSFKTSKYPLFILTFWLTYVHITFKSNVRWSSGYFYCKPILQNFICLYSDIINMSIQHHLQRILIMLNWSQLFLKFCMLPYVNNPWIKTNSYQITHQRRLSPFPIRVDGGRSNV